MKKSRPIERIRQPGSPKTQVMRCTRTYDETFHLVLPYHLYSQGLLGLVVVLESPSARGHDAQLFRCRAIELSVVFLQSAHKVDTRVYPLRLKFDEIEPAAYRAFDGFAGEVYEFGKGAANLHVECSVSFVLHVPAAMDEGRGASGVRGSRAASAAGDVEQLTSTATWLTTAVWFGSLISLGSCS